MHKPIHIALFIIYTTHLIFTSISVFGFLRYAHVSCVD